ncbi:MAG: VanW family protein [Peptoniphilus sp.]|nr:VanW family protein [Peptoniphilus sp.]
MNKKQIAVIAILALLTAAFFYYSIESKKEVIHRGTKISKIDVGNMSREEALKKIKDIKAEELKNSKFEFTALGESYFIDYDDMGYSLDVEKAVEEAYNVGRSQSYFKNFWDITSRAIFNRNINLEESFDNAKVDETINTLVMKVYKEPVSAGIYYDENNGFTLLNSENGRYADASQLKQLIMDNIAAKNSVEIPLIISYPAIREEEFEGIDSLYAEFSTDYAKSIQNRKDNILLGSGYFNDLLVKPKEEISFNNTVGTISSATGFKDAAVIINGEFDQGIGGGICQVSTTLYNALIRSDLEIVERHNHSRPISYVPLGTDAAVAEGYKDLKFVNNTDHNIYIKSFADGSELKFQIFGNAADRDYEVEIVPKLLSVNEPNTVKKYTVALEEGESKVEKKGAKGYSYATYKEIIKDGEVVETVKISNSNYIAQDKVVLIGEGAAENKGDKSEKTSKKGQ